MNLNRVILIGRLAADPESRTTAGGQSVASMRIVTNRVWKDQSGQKQEQAEFHSITLWGRLAQIATQYLKKGGLVMVEGRLQTRSWTGQDNVKKYRTEIVAENIQLGPKPGGEASAFRPENNSFQSNSNYPNSNYGASQKFTSHPPAGGSALPSESKEEEIPVINEDEPISEPIISSNEIEEAEIDLKDIPF